MLHFRPVKSLVAACALAALLSGCYEVERFGDRMKISQEQMTKIRPIIEEYLKRQDTLLDEMSQWKPNRDSQSGGSLSSGTSDWAGGSPDRLDMKAAMEKHKAEMDQKFKDNDDQAALALTPLVTPEQLADFRKMAEDYRNERIRDMSSNGHGGGHHGGGHGGGMGGSGMGGGGGFGGHGGGF